MKLVKEAVELERVLVLYQRTECWGRGWNKWENERVKCSGAASQMAEEWEDIMNKKHVASAKLNELGKEKKEEMFKEFTEI